jgi:hypothetical protein
MLLALVPAFGAIAYVASDTMIRNGLGRMLLDQSAHKVPFGLYRRLGLARVTAPRFPQPATAGLGVGFSSHETVVDSVPVRIGG